MEIKLVLPVSVMVPKKYSQEKYVINLNNYGHRFKRAKAKIIYEAIVEKERKKVAPDLFFAEYYVLYIHHPNHENIDTANVLSVCSKFALDGLQTKKSGRNKGKRLFKNDSRKEVKGECYLPGKLAKDKKSQYIELFIYDNRKEFLQKINSCYDELDGRTNPKLDL